MNIFYAMSFTGKRYENIVSERKSLHILANQLNLNLLEQFIGIEEKEKFEANVYDSSFIVEKDRDLIRQADVVIADFSEPSIGRDCEIVIAKELLKKRVISIVPDEKMRSHPWIRFYSDLVVRSPEDALVQAKIIQQHL